jgi:hypothetical protein
VRKEERLSFIKLNDQIHSKFFTVAEEDCNLLSPKHAEIVVQNDTSCWPKDIMLFKTREDAGQYARDYWEDFIDCEAPEEVVAFLGAETLISWALGRLAGPGSAKVRNLEEWLDLYIDTPEEHFEEEYEIDAIASNLVEVLGFKPEAAFSFG